MESFIALCVLLLVGHWLRTKVRLIRKLYLPSCVVAGVLGLVIIQVCRSAGTPIPDVWTLGWKALPIKLVNVVFACLFLGVVIPKVSTLARRAGPQLGYGQIVAWGQYVVSLGLFLVLLQHVWPDLNEMFGAIVPVGFEGGHGTATALAPEFAKKGWAEGGDVALASATAGIVSAVVVGMVLINWAVRRGHLVRKQSPQQIANTPVSILEDQRPSAGKLTVSPDAVGSLTLHLAIVGLACGVGWGIKQGLIGVGELIGHADVIQVAKDFPLFPLCMLGGLVVQLGEQRFDKAKLIDHGLMRRIQNLALDFLVVAAIAKIDVVSLTSYLAPFAILVTAGIVWNVFCVLVLAKRLLPNAWFERSIAEMGQSMGVTATGLLLLRVVDPQYESPAVDAFASKQLLHEPFMGGGLWTTSAVLLLAGWGVWPVFWIASGAMVAWLVILIVARLTRQASSA
ncbi:MAG: sodium/glutamate symporter [Planctomycetota bacterium]|jgi:ESS family glutamate:Na+ symporter